jgi:hypothetical protein
MNNNTNSTFVSEGGGVNDIVATINSVVSDVKKTSVT